MTVKANLSGPLLVAILPGGRFYNFDEPFDRGGFRMELVAYGFFNIEENKKYYYV